MIRGCTKIAKFSMSMNPGVMIYYKNLIVQLKKINVPFKYLNCASELC